MKYNDNNKFSNAVKTRIIIEKNGGWQCRCVSDAHGAYIDVAFKTGLIYHRGYILNCLNVSCIFPEVNHVGTCRG